MGRRVHYRSGSHWSDDMGAVVKTLSRNYRYRYCFFEHFGTWTHQWELVGRDGAVHLHISDYGPRLTEAGLDRISGGIEFHYRTPPKYMDGPPSHNECFLLKAPCWHDGSSLWATEYWIPLWRADPNNHIRLFEQLAIEADKKFQEEKENEDES